MAPYYLQREVQSLLQAIGCIGLSWSPIKEDGSHQTSAFKNMAPYYHRREVHDLHAQRDPNIKTEPSDKSTEVKAETSVSSERSHTVRPDSPNESTWIGAETSVSSERSYTVRPDSPNENACIEAVPLIEFQSEEDENEDVKIKIESEDW
ncbi:hypothetical protein MMC28_004896 [Mycoblastus sanguinarius]|nr:hypothetical protein [Mycoblastus sanguinarius]